MGSSSVSSIRGILLYIDSLYWEIRIPLSPPPVFMIWFDNVDNIISTVETITINKSLSFSIDPRIKVLVYKTIESSHLNGGTRSPISVQLTLGTLLYDAKYQVPDYHIHCPLYESFV